MAPRASRNFSYRLSVDNAEKTKKDFKEVGDAAQSGLGKVEKGGKDASVGLEKTSRSADKANTKILKLKSSGNELERTLRKFVSIAVFTQFTRNTIQTGLAFEKIQIGLETALGSAKKAKDEFAFLSTELDRLGLPILSTTDAFTKLAASARGTRLEGQGVRDLFIGLSEAAAVYRLTQEQINGVFKAYTDSISKGFVQMEELKGQLGDRLPGVLRLAAKGMGLTTAELVKMIEVGKLATEDFLPKFNKALREDVAGGLDKASVSAQASLNRFNNSIDKLQITFTEAGFLDAVSQFVQLMTTFLENENVQAGAEKLGQGFGVLADALKDPQKNFVDPLKALYYHTFNSREEAEKLVDALVEARKESDQTTNKPFASAPSAPILQRPTQGSSSAQAAIDALKEEVSLVAQLGKESSKVFQEQTNLKRIFASIEKQITEEQRSNADVQIEFTDKQKEAIKSLLEQKRELLEAEKKEEAFLKNLKNITEEYADLTPTVADNIDIIRKWKEEMLSSLDETDSRYQEFSEMVDTIFREKIGKANEEALEKTDGFIAGLERGMMRLSKQTSTIADDIEDAFTKMSEGMTDALFEFIDKGKFGLEGLRKLAADILKDIAKGILQRSVVNPLIGIATSFVSNLAGGIAGGLSGATSAGASGGGFGGSGSVAVAHTGGIVGLNTRGSRNVPMGLFANAPRFHDGLLRADEVPAILQKGERVIPKNAEIGGNGLTINIYAQDAQSVIQNRGQVGASLFNEMQRAKRRNR